MWFRFLAVLRGVGAGFRSADVRTLRNPAPTPRNTARNQKREAATGSLTPHTRYPSAISVTVALSRCT